MFKLVKFLKKKNPDKESLLNELNQIFDGKID